jgi:HupE / UreJ protein
MGGYRQARGGLRHAAGKLLFIVPALLAGLVSVPSGSLAHDANMAVLQLEEHQPGSFMTRWILRSDGPALTPRFPDHCRFEAPLLECGDAGLSGRIALAGLGAGQSAAILRITYRDGHTQVFTLTADAPGVSIAASLAGGGMADWLRVAGAYVVLGIEHILLGLDHLLFVLGLMWIVRSRWMLGKTITAFTVAHSITLAVTTLGWVGVPEGPVNAAIALSIVFVGVEMLRQEAGQGGLASRFPWVVAFAFGLLHGFGFADGLAKLGLPANILPVGLLAFNMGVEVGQLAFVFLVLALGWACRVLLVRWPRWSIPLPAYAIGSLAAFWFIGRMDVLLTAS